MLMKSAHFVPVWMDYSMDRLAKLYLNEIERLHGVPFLIVSERSVIYVKILERVIVNIGYSSQLQYSFSLANKWTVGEINSDIRRYAKRLRYKFS